MTIRKIETLLLQISMFLIPTNMAVHWYSDNAYLNGHLVDYFLPKVYLSDIPVILLLGIGVLKNKHLVSYKGLFNTFLIVLLAVYLLLRSLWTQDPSGSIWYSIKVAEMLIFAAYLATYPLKQLLSTVRVPLLLSAVIQSIIGIIQYINQKSLFGYILLGESDLERVGVAHTTLFGLVEVAPYGTTAHPNILAGFITIVIIILFISSHISPIATANKAAKIGTISLFSLILLLTGSWGAIGALSISFLVYQTIKLTISRRSSVIIQAACVSTLVIAPIILALMYHSKTMIDNDSFSIRYELNQVATNVWKQHPLTGVGPNQFIRELPTSTLKGQKTLFLQPVHNIFLLILSETGLIGLVLVALCIYPLYKRSNDLTIKLPFYALLLIGSLDHYPLTLQTGQLLLALSLGIAFSKTRPLSLPSKN